MLSHGQNWIIISALAVANISYQALIPTVISTTFALVTVMLRMYSRAWLSRNIQVEDYCVGVAMFLSIAMAGLVGTEFAIRSDRLAKATSPKALKVTLKVQELPLYMTLALNYIQLLYAQSLLYHFSINLIKTSILIQYRRLFGNISPVTFHLTTVLGMAVAISFAWGFFGVLFLCTPIQKYWIPNVPGTCIDAESHLWSTAILGILLDVAIWLLPMPMVGRLKLEGKQKMGLYGVSGLGAFVCVVSILRLVMVHDAVQKGEITKSGTHALVWSTAELNVALICTSLFVMKPLILRVFPKLICSDTGPGSATEDGKAYRRWLITEMLRNRLVLDIGGNGRGPAVYFNDDEESRRGVVVTPRSASDDLDEKKGDHDRRIGGIVIK